MYLNMSTALETWRWPVSISFRHSEGTTIRNYNEQDVKMESYQPTHSSTLSQKKTCL